MTRAPACFRSTREPQISPPRGARQRDFDTQCTKKVTTNGNGRGNLERGSEIFVEAAWESHWPPTEPGAGVAEMVDADTSQVSGHLPIRVRISASAPTAQLAPRANLRGETACGTLPLLVRCPQPFCCEKREPCDSRAALFRYALKGACEGAPSFPYAAAASERSPFDCSVASLSTPPNTSTARLMSSIVLMEIRDHSWS